MLYSWATLYRTGSCFHPKLPSINAQAAAILLTASTETLRWLIMPDFCILMGNFHLFFSSVVTFTSRRGANSLNRRVLRVARSAKQWGNSLRSNRPRHAILRIFYFFIGQTSGNLAACQLHLSPGRCFWSPGPEKLPSSSSITWLQSLVAADEIYLLVFAYYKAFGALKARPC